MIQPVRVPLPAERMRILHKSDLEAGLPIIADKICSLLSYSYRVKKTGQMLNFIRQTLTGRGREHPDTSPSSEERTRIAASVILLEAAHADNACTDEELDHVIDTLRSDFNLS